MVRKDTVTSGGPYRFKEAMALVVRGPVIRSAQRVCRTPAVTPRPSQ